MRKIKSTKKYLLLSINKNATFKLFLGMWYYWEFRIFINFCAIKLN
jgi:hypothetical protein